MCKRNCNNFYLMSNFKCFLSCRCHVADILCEDASDDLSLPVCLLEALLQVQYIIHVYISICLLI